MLTYRRPLGGLARVLLLLGAVVYAPVTSRAEAQERRNLFEVGAAGAYQSFNSTTRLDGAAGGLGRIGVWLPLNLGLELEGSISSANSQTTNNGVGVKTGSLSLLYNLLFGSRNSAYAKFGFGQTKYGNSGDCAAAGRTICGSTNTFVGGLGVRIGITPLLLARGEVVINPNKGSSTISGEERTFKFSNYGLNLGLSFMLGSKPIPDSDGDGVLNNRDRCADTPAGAQVNGFGCPADNDGDGVANGIDKCPNTAVGAIVDAAGCTHDSDGDNIADGIDKCPDTPAGVLVDSTGCPRDSDGDGIADGLDRCSATPKGATVDALGCPGDEDADGVLDGLDRCPRTPIGATVNRFGCPAGQQPGRQPPPTQPSAGAPPPDTSAARAGAAEPRPPAPTEVTPLVLEGVSFESGSARLQIGSYIQLDSIATVLKANPSLRVEIGGHTDDAGTPADNQHLSTLRAEAVRNYLVAKGVPFQQMVARGYGSTVPRTPDTTPRGRALNRRVEIKPLPPSR
jgi:outer membrane protein OmpA-like peptidoglycan-associated protein